MQDFHCPEQKDWPPRYSAPVGAEVPLMKHDHLTASTDLSNIHATGNIRIRPLDTAYQKSQGDLLGLPLKGCKAHGSSR